MTGTVDRKTYFFAGLLLALLKYAVELCAIGVATGLVYTPIDFVAPLLSSRERFFDAGSAWIGPAWVAWTAPFVWIAVAMTLRRARDARLSPWLCLLILVPLLNFVTMVAMCLAASAPGRRLVSTADRAVGDEPAEDEAVSRFAREVWRAPAAASPPMSPRGQPGGGPSSGLLSALGGLAAGVVYTIGLMLLSVYGFGSYGAAMFFGGPVVAGAAAAYLYNRPAQRTLGVTIGHGVLMAVCCSLAFLLVGLEGVICLVMATPILAPLTLFGSAIGWAIAAGVESHSRQEDRGLVVCLLVLPMLAGFEPLIAEPERRLVESAVEIAASPSQVWDVVVAFPEIEAEPEWFFRWGIAAPTRARIEGVGVGAIRYCEFTTGAFVEPITAWDEPRRLAFDVADQPEPMFELTPYRHLHPPHLRTSFRSRRGEFELCPLPSGGTRLVGRTWYDLDIAPHGYWRHWTDEIVHRIHSRVLRHIGRVAEASEPDLQVPESSDA